MHLPLSLQRTFCSRFPLSDAEVGVESFVEIGAEVAAESDTEAGAETSSVAGGNCIFIIPLMLYEFSFIVDRS